MHGIGEATGKLLVAVCGGMVNSAFAVASWLTILQIEVGISATAAWFTWQRAASCQSGTGFHAASLPYAASQEKSRTQEKNQPWDNPQRLATASSFAPSDWPGQAGAMRQGTFAERGCVQTSNPYCRSTATFWRLSLAVSAPCFAELGKGAILFASIAGQHHLFGSPQFSRAILPSWHLSRSMQFGWRHRNQPSPIPTRSAQCRV